MASASKSVLIVGAGVAGTVTAIRLLRLARTPLEVILLDREDAKRQGGIAYSAAGNTWHNVFNIQIGRMAPFRDHPDDLLEWANAEADRSQWDPEWREVTFGVHDAAPRRMYQLYLEDRLERAKRDARDGVVLREALGEVIDLDEDESSVRATISDYCATPTDRPTPNAEVVVDHAILATGIEIARHPFGEQLEAHRAFVPDEYSPRGVRLIDAIDPTATVVVIGTALTAFDAVNQLLRTGHTGPIHMISRHAAVFESYPTGYHHEFLKVRRPPLLDQPYRGKRALVDAVSAEWRYLNEDIARNRPDIPPGVRSERIVKAWEPYLPELLAAMPPEDVKELLDEYDAIIAVHRVSSMSYTNDVVERAMTGPSPQVVVDRAAVAGIDPIDDDQLAVRLHDEHGDREIRAGLVIRNLAQEHDYAEAGSTLWTSLVGRGIAQPHRTTGRGVEVGRWGDLRHPDGTRSNRISVLGAAREGDEIARHGRLGPFAKNNAVIKDQCVCVAAQVLAHLQDRALPEALMSEDDTIAALERAGCGRLQPDDRMTVREDLRARVVEAIRRLVAVTPAERDAVTERPVPACLADVPDAKATLSNYALGAALTKITDFSMPPRALRAALGLDHGGTQASDAAAHGT